MNRSSKISEQAHQTYKDMMKCYFRELPKIYGGKENRKGKQNRKAEEREERTTASSTMSFTRTGSGVFRRELSCVMGALSASSWSLHDLRTGQRCGSKQNVQREIASLTKIMTCLVVLQAVEEYGMSFDVRMTVTTAAVRMAGTSSRLVLGSEISIEDALYALMLPSGNDAAYLLAENIGLLLTYGRVKLHSRSSQHSFSSIQSIDLSSYEDTDRFVASFVKQMNRRAKQLGLDSTNFDNPHGMQVGENLSTTSDILALSRYCQSNPAFMRIVSCVQRVGVLYRSEHDSEEPIKCTLKWRNTNSLLHQGWQGLKTGHTTTAGGCLSSYRQGIFIVVLNSATQQSRFLDTQRLFEWHSRRFPR